MGGVVESTRSQWGAGLSIRAGGGRFLSAIRVWCAGYEDRIKADIKSSQPEVSIKIDQTVPEIQAIEI